MADQLEDLEDSWQWTRSHLPGVLERHAPGHSVDLSHLLLTGGSAGGYCVMQLALSHPNDISAVAAAYPFLDPKDDLIVKGPTAEEPTILRFPREDIPSKEAVVAWIKETRKTVASRAELERPPFAVGAAQYGIFYSEIFDNRNLNQPEFLPIERIKACANLPKKMYVENDSNQQRLNYADISRWILHGDDDTVVHIRASHKFVDLVREKLPDTTIRFDIAPGEDHAFDLVKASWELHAIGAMEFVRQSWLGD